MEEIRAYIGLAFLVAAVIFNSWRKHTKPNNIAREKSPGASSGEKKELSLGGEKILEIKKDGVPKGSKRFNKEIRDLIWAPLKEAGFTTFTSRTAWRHLEDRIDVFNFWFYGRRYAEPMKLGPASFCVNFGSYLRYIPPFWPPDAKEGPTLPKESHCTFRGRMLRSIPQSSNRYPTMWSVDEEGSNFEACIEDVCKRVPQVLRWFDGFSEKAEVLRVLLEEPEDMQGTWGVGNNLSPHRSCLAGYVALDLGRIDLAKEKFQEVVKSGSHSKLFSSVDEAMERARK